MKIIGEIIDLREIQEKDLPLLNELINDKEIAKMTVGSSKHVTMRQQLEWFKSLSKSDDIRLAIIDKENNAIGTCIINSIDEDNGKCSIGIKLHKTAQGKGFGTEAIRLTIKYIFSTLKLHRIYVKILEINIPSIKLFEKCGFTLEGKEIDSIKKNGKYINLLTYGLINND